MHLVIFDIDGTLTQTGALDAECFLKVMRQHVEFDEQSVDWNMFEHVTDEGIARSLLERNGHRADIDSALAQIREEFVIRLEETVSQIGVEPVPGAIEMVERLTQSSIHLVAVATGAWAASARLKLIEAGIPLKDLPLASSDDSHRRADIIELARQRARSRAGSSIQSTVYVGDGLWDLRAAGRVGCGFVGVGCGEHAERLQRAGASWVLPHFNNEQECARALDRAAASTLTGPGESW